MDVCGHAGKVREIQDGEVVGSDRYDGGADGRLICGRDRVKSVLIETVARAHM